MHKHKQDSLKKCMMVATTVLIKQKNADFWEEVEIAISGQKLKPGCNF